LAATQPPQTTSQDSINALLMLQLAKMLKSENEHHDQSSSRGRTRSTGFSQEELGLAQSGASKYSAEANSTCSREKGRAFKFKFLFDRHHFSQTGESHLEPDLAEQSQPVCL